VSLDVAATVPVVFGDDVAACADPIRGYAALYLGGMGSRTQNFYNQLACRMGFEAAAREVQDLYLDRRHREAMAAVPLEFVDQTSLLGPMERVAERLQAYQEAGVTTVNVTTFAPNHQERVATLRRIAEALDHSGLGSD
jgi:alkanesulfonate monooxygenase SsuD/methylene tetrahydromethanopterin reductase-like flavin-dependent oxidoreductase (luciferase family)